ncbi:MAG: TIGR04086 family membrane protein [Bacillota bacterium]|jgi:putative membrane protein (TIGR04086 family)
MSYRSPNRPDYRGWATRNRADEGFSAKAAGGGLLWAISLALLLVVVAAAVVYFSNLDERVLSWVVNLGSFVALGCAAFLTARRQASHGLLYGVAIGAGYALVTLVFGSLLFPPFIGVLPFLKRLGFSVVAGACGGILGVNY